MSQINKNKNPSAHIDESLARTFAFTASDLEANRSGEMTDQQRQRLNQTGGYATRNILLTLLGIVVVGTVGFGWVTFRNQADMEAAIRTAIIAAIVMLVIVGVIMVWIVQGNMRATRSGTVKRKSGSIWLKTQETENTTLYFLGMGGEDFSITGVEYFALKDFEQKEVTIYYTPAIKKIVSLELLG